MGQDIDIFVLQGYKLTLSLAMQMGLINPEILENDDDYMLIDEDESRDAMIERYVQSSILKEILKDNWRIYILASSQDDIDVDQSYFFVYNQKQDIYVGRVPDYLSKEIIGYPRKQILNLYKIDKDYPWKYRQHLVVEGSW